MHERAIRAIPPAGRLRDLLRPLWRALPVSRRRDWVYLRSFGRLPRRRRPRTFSEKLNWRALHDRREMLACTCDKLAAKDLARRHGVASARTLWSGTDVRELAGADLGEHWVLKPNHRGNGIVHFGRGPADPAELAAVTCGWLAPGSDELRMGEWAYSRARRLLLVEERLGPPDRAPVDYKFLVFAGEPALVQVHGGRFGDYTLRYYRPDWTPVAAQVTDVPLGPVTPPPPHLGEMLDVAARIGSGFEFMRVDLYDLDDGPRFGELTPYPGSGMTDFTLAPWLDAELGALWDLPR